MQYGPLVIAIASLVTGILFATVTAVVRQRSRTQGDRTAHVALACAWGGFAFMACNDAVRILVGAYRPEWFPLYTALAVLKVLANGAVIWGLGVHVAHLWLGHARGWRLHLGLYAIAHCAFFLYAYRARHAVGTTTGAWVPRLVFDGPPVLPHAIGLMALALYFVPPLVLVILLAAHGRNETDQTARDRIRATTIALAAFQVANMYQSNPYIPGDSPLFPLLAALTLLSGVIAWLAHGAGPGPFARLGAPLAARFHARRGASHAAGAPTGATEATEAVALGDTLK